MATVHFLRSLGNSTSFRGNPKLMVGALALIAFYLLRRHRWKRYYQIHEQYEAKWKAGSLTPAEAQQIIHVGLGRDLVFALKRAIGFALFKTYAIPSISKLLSSTQEHSTREKVSKRYADTEILIGTWLSCPVNGFLDPSKSSNERNPVKDPRVAIALARTNYLHSRYKISNDEYLYTLSLFVLEPPRWADRFGWRSLSPMEKDAWYIFWKDIGLKMNIRDIPPNRQAMDAWSRAYEETYMLPSLTNHKVASATLEELIYAVPAFLGLNALVKRIIICLLEDRVRIAMMYSQPSLFLRTLVQGLMTSLWIVQRYFGVPPRNAPWVVDPKLPDGEVVFRPTIYKSVPWYKAEPTGPVSRFIESLRVTLGLQAVMPDPRYRSSGYRIEQLGPTRYENDGHDFVFQEAARISKCPIPSAWTP
ncbi:hypothetical protein CC1G_09164 [Coprinopsis cinerea okayama7|uniref:ER-bound oxygenase mpaB/mpaB'/Rubber oxygenase catalytic domain-containing protein n=1 Tax=Coprinopsis cinerea (strain Okayama-7 / 130 / ATCC MYA-4618 / FGSC 9003) TaxID=240176 RepID=A8P9S9_COPC7|nr:hypothetical protein CC1G_09164 [Coprinopsis cinerea okayama7\|eukprot:XP_001839830.2 hypothetical protein CC1G_09164 [Coprinopsis cinerea okayama7\